MEHTNREMLIFYAMDIVDSTPLKPIRDNWAKDIANSYNGIIDLISKRHNKQFKFWKFNGDEWILVQSVKTCQEIIYGVNLFSEIHEIVKNDFRIRSRIWMSLPYELYEIALYQRRDDYALSQERGFGQVDFEEKVKKDFIIEDRDWVGHSLDLGFRFGKDIPPYHISLSSQIAYILFHENIVKDFLEEFSFYQGKVTVLKGIGYPSLNITLHKNTKQYENNTMITTAPNQDEFKKIHMDSNKKIDETQRAIFLSIEEYIKHTYGNNTINKMNNFIHNSNS